MCESEICGSPSSCESCVPEREGDLERDFLVLERELERVWDLEWDFFTDREKDLWSDLVQECCSQHESDRWRTNTQEFKLGLVFV